MNTIKLPIDFENRMKAMLQDEYNAYIASFNDPASKAVHLNTNICSVDRLLKDFGDDFELLPYSDNGFISHVEKIGSHPLHHAGVLYSQDPGALMPVCSIPYEFTDKDIVLDMCAAPGGKSSQLAIILEKAGAHLVSNEINKSRNTILRSNMERMGYRNQLITNMDSEEIAASFPGVFSFILVDAPCSGEGMFRKYPESIDEWSVSNVEMCSQRQKEILDNVLKALRPGGYLLYSTCTYSREENEDIIHYLLDNYDLELVPLRDRIMNYSTALGNEPGAHFFPHLAYGEGQYMCLLHSTNARSEYVSNYSYREYTPSLPKAGKNIVKIIKEAINQDFIDTLNLYIDKDNIYSIDPYPYMLPRKSISRLGVYMGTIVKNRFEPSHMFFKIYGSKLSNVIDLSNNTDMAIKYLKGEELFIENAPKGYGAFSYYGGILGGFKSAGGRLKNHYPKGLRNNN